MIEIDAKGLNITWPDGFAFTFHPIWLRERSFEASNKDPATGHRLQEVAFLPLNLTVEDTELLSGEQVGLRFSDGHSCSFGLDDSDQVVVADSDSLSRYYAARRLFAELIWSDEMMLRFKLQPGEAYIVDNYRLLHGRTAIELATGDRHLRQCYMDRDILSSRQKVLGRRLCR